MRMAIWCDAIAIKAENIDCGEVRTCNNQNTVGFLATSVREIRVKPLFRYCNSRRFSDGWGLLECSNTASVSFHSGRG